MSALGELLEEWRDGDEVRMEDTVRWSMLNFTKGDFVEVPFSATDWPERSIGVAGFLILEKMVTGDGGLALRVRSVGSSDGAQVKALSNRFNRREGFLHLCISRPCTEAEDSYLHVTSLRVFSHHSFNPKYYTGAAKRQVGKWLEVVEKDGAGLRDEELPEGGTEEFPEDVEALETEETSRRVSWASPGGDELNETLGQAAPKRRGQRPGALRSNPAASARARGKGLSTGGDGLKEVANQGSGDTPRAGRGVQAVRKEGKVAEELHLGSSKEREELSTEELRKKLDQVRMKLGGAPRPSISDLRSLPEEDENEGRSWEQEQDSGCVEEIRGLSSGSSLKRRKKDEDTKGSTSKNISVQLIHRAQQLAGERDQREASGSKKAGEDETKKKEREQILSLLNQVAGERMSASGGGRDPPKESRGRSHSKKKRKRRSESTRRAPRGGSLSTE